MAEEEDVTLNRAYIALTTTYSHLYQSAEKNGYLVCIPVADSIGCEISAQFLETHILQKGFMPGEYSTINGKCVTVTNKVIATDEGFTEQRSVKILFEEVFYGSSSKAVKIFCIEAPLEGKIAGNKEQLIPIPEGRTFSVAREFLFSFPENVFVLNQIIEKIENFPPCFEIVKNFQVHLVKGVKDIYEEAVEALLCTNISFRQVHDSGTSLAELKELIEVYVLNRFHQHLWRGVTDMLRPEDEEIYSIAENLTNIRLADLGVRKNLRCSMLKALRKFQKLDECHSGLEKLLCLRDSINLISETVENTLKSNNRSGQDFITTDDLIPFLLYIIILSKPRNLRSNIFFMQNLTFTNTSVNELGYNLTCLEGSVKYLIEGYNSGKIKLNEGSTKPAYVADTNPKSLGILPGIDDTQTVSSLDESPSFPDSPFDSLEQPQPQHNEKKQDMDASSVTLPKMALAYDLPVPVEILVDPYTNDFIDVSTKNNKKDQQHKRYSKNDDITFNNMYKSYPSDNTTGSNLKQAHTSTTLTKHKSASNNNNNNKKSTNNRRNNNAEFVKQDRYSVMVLEPLVVEPGKPRRRPQSQIYDLKTLENAGGIQRAQPARVRGRQSAGDRHSAHDPNKWSRRSASFAVPSAHSNKMSYSNNLIRSSSTANMGQWGNSSNPGSKRKYRHTRSAPPDIIPLENEQQQLGSFLTKLKGFGRDLLGRDHTW